MHHVLSTSLIVTLLASTAAAADPTNAAAPVPVVDLAAKQGQLADKFKRLEALMLKMAEYDATNNPRRAALLRQALESSKERLVAFRLETLVDLFQQEQLQRAADDQQSVQQDLKALLDLLLSENRADRLQSEQARIRGYIKELDRIIRMQRAVQGRTEGGDDPQRLSEDQQRIAERARELGAQMDEAEQATKGQDGSSSESESQPSDGAKDGHSDGSPDDPGKPSEKSKNPAEKSADGDSQDGDKQDGDKQDGDKQDGDKQDGDKQDGDKQDGDKQKPNGQPSDSESRPGNNGADPSDGQPSQGQPSQGQPSQGQPSQGQPSQGQPGESSEQEPSRQAEPAGRERIAAAEEKMREAERRLTEANRKSAVQEQEEARRQLELAKAELEEILRQMREEEVERVLAMLEGRFRKMLEMQLRVYDDTLRLNKIAAAKRSRQFTIQCGKLGQEESKIVLEVDKALALLKEEGSSVAFPEAVMQMRVDMQNVARRLSEEQVGRLTQGVEEDVIAALEEIVAALQKAQQDAEQRRNQPPPPGEPMSGDPEDQPLVDSIAELKMIRALQMRVNKRTQSYAEMLENVDDPIGQADDQELVQSLQDLAQRQRRIHEVTRDIVLGKNK